MCFQPIKRSVYPSPKINVKAIADKLAGGVASHTVVKHVCSQHNNYDHFNREVAVSAFKCARFFSPAKVVEQEVTFTSFTFSLS